MKKTVHLLLYLMDQTFALDSYSMTKSAHSEKDGTTLVSDNTAYLLLAFVLHRQTTHCLLHQVILGKHLEVKVCMSYCMRCTAVRTS